MDRAATPPLRSPDTVTVTVRSSLPGADLRWLAALLPILLVAGLLLVRGGLVRSPLALTAGVAGLAPAELTAVAADQLERVSAPGGAGFTFEIVQTAALVAREGSPGIEVGDPTDPAKVILVERHELATYLERGSATGDAFHAEIRAATPGAVDDGWDAAPMELAALVLKGVTYRNDGAGWYETSEPPGIGLDPASVHLLPGMLRNLGGTADAPAADGAVDPLADRLADLRPARTLAGTARVADLPGIIAVDLAEATELIEPVTLAFDADGRLIGLRAVARNIHFAAHNLVISTVITFEYPLTAPELPRPEPAYVAPSVIPDETGE